jgi:hypothetical protein
LIKTIATRIRTALDRFIRAHIVDDESNLWPDLANDPNYRD